MATVKNEIRAKFIVKEGTNVRQFQAAIRAIFKGEDDGTMTAYALDHIEDVVCGWDPAERAENGRKGGRPRKSQ
jgi:hypothetical protein